MHRHDALGRQDVVHDREDGLLHLAGIGRAADQDDFFGEVDRDHRFGGRAMLLRIGAEVRQIDDREFRDRSL